MFLVLSVGESGVLGVGRGVSQWECRWGWGMSWVGMWVGLVYESGWDVGGLGYESARDVGKVGAVLLWCGWGLCRWSDWGWSQV